MRLEGPTRRYALGFTIVAVAGGLLMLASALMVLERVEWLDRANRSQVALDLAPFMGTLLDRVWNTHQDAVADPSDPAAWAALALPLRESLKDLPYLSGLAAHNGAGALLCRVGTLEAEAEAGLVPPAVRELGDGVLLLAFRWRRGEDQDGPGVVLHARLVIPPKSRELASIRNFTIFGTVLLTVVIYLLAALAVLMTRAQARKMNRAHERAGRLQAVAKVAGGIAHEVRNPLNAISLMLQYLERKVKKTGQPPEAGDYARIHLELGKIRKVVDNFVKFARARELEVASVDMGAVVQSVLTRFSLAFEEAAVTLDLEESGDLRCAADREKIVEVLEAVVTNSLEAMRHQGHGSLSVRVSGGRKEVSVTVRDTGDVLDERQMKSIFEPYFTTRDSALGLGMTVARTLVESHGGSIEASAAQGGGCVVTISLPRSFF